MNVFRRVLYDGRTRQVEVDDKLLLSIHRQILQEKRLLRSAFLDFYREMTGACDRHFEGEGTEIELGSGAGFLKDVRPQVVTTDVRSAPHIDRHLDAMNMALSDRSARCVYAINVFHHLPDPDRFFQELLRVLVPGGGCVLIEPHSGPLSSIVHKRLHKDEYFDPDESGWKNDKIRGPLSGANQALAHMSSVAIGPCSSSAIRNCRFC